ncbi:MAG: CRP/FNR family transcriptional regulator [Gammaproteobacteria bacterium]|jgi:CRP/FNR family transcriptional regulator
MSTTVQTVTTSNGHHAAARSQSLNGSINIHDCHSCDPRGGCLAAAMMTFPGQVSAVRQSNRTNKPNEHLFREGDESSGLYVIKSGSVKLYLTTDDGEEQVLGFYLRGDVIGIDGQEHERSHSSAVTLETTSVCKLPLSQFSDQGRGRGYPGLIVEQMGRTNNLVLMLASKDADGRLACFLCDLSLRFEKSGYSATTFNLSMSRQDIGSYLGLAIETVSRTLSRFQDSGLLQVSRRKLEILDLEALKKIAGAQAAT